LIAADDAHVIFGTAYDESLGDHLRVTVIATGLSSARKAIAQPPVSVVQLQPQPQVAHPMLRTGTGTDNLPILNHVAQAGPAMQGASPQQHSYQGLNPPSVWRSPEPSTHRAHRLLLPRSRSALRAH
jgi:cell division protein FtsZ